MEDFIIDPSKVSFQEIKEELEDFISSRPDAEQWSQFFLSSTGQTVIEIVASYAAYLKLDSVLARRENYLQYAKTRGAVVAGGQVLGYSAFRGRNSVITIEFTPTNSTTLPQFYRLGDVSGFGLLLLNATTVSAGVPITVECVVGDLLSEVLQAQSDNAQKFRFTQKRVSQDIRMSIGSTEVPTSSDILKLLENEFYVQSNAIGSVDALFLNEGTITFNSGQNITLEYVELKDLEFTEQNVSLDETEGVLSTVEITELYLAPETKESIQLKAPLENETKFTIRGRNDYQKLLLQADSTFIAAGGRDVSPAVVEAFAVKNDLSVLSTAEKNDLVIAVSANRPFGVQPPIIIDPVPNFLELTITICLVPGVTGSAEDQIRAILATYEKQLSNPEEVQKVDFKVLEAQINDLDIIRINRVLVTAPAWSALTAKARGNHVSPIVPGLFIHEAFEFVRYSGATEPAWPNPIPPTPPETENTYGQTIDDNELVWVSIPQDTQLDAWTANSVYRVGDRVKVTGSGNTPDASFEVQSIKHFSETSTGSSTATVLYEGVNFTADNVGAVGNSISLVFDGSDDIDTVIGLWNLNNPSNTVSHDGTGTDVLNAGTANLSGGQDAFDAEPSWPVPANPPLPDEESFVKDNQILWLMVAKEGTPPAWSSNTEYNVGDSVVPTNVLTGQSDIMFQMVAFIGKTGALEPTWPTTFGDTVISGHVNFITRNKDSGPESPELNEYYIIDETVVVDS